MCHLAFVTAVIKRASLAEENFMCVSPAIIKQKSSARERSSPSFAYTQGRSSSHVAHHIPMCEQSVLEKTFAGERMKM